MRFSSISLTLVSTLWLSSSLAETCKHRIYFLPQTHASEYADPDRMDQQQMDKIVSSQLKIANFIDRFPGIPVFTEQAAEQDYTVSSFSAEQIGKIQKYMKSIFRGPLPETITALNPVQKQKLYDNGGEFIQFMLGRLDTLHRVVRDKQKLDEIFNPINDWVATKPPRDIPYPSHIGGLVYGEREKEALIQVNKYLEENPRQKDVILIFGSNHSFQFYPKQFPPQCVYIPPEFRADWGGRFREGPNGFPNNTEIHSSKGPSSAVR